MRSGPALTSTQIEFIHMLINYLTENGIVDKKILYRQPFTDLDNAGVSGVFEGRVKQLFQVIDAINSHARATA
ncbi:type I restriction-modification enzyme R subunit C-terminal domain-containing protein [Spirosoma aerophilum]